MASEPEFQRVQREFCAHLRDPRKVSAPSDIEDRRMAIYRRLFLNNVCSLIERMFPTLAEILGSETLKELCYDFYSQHCCRTPYFHQIGLEFVQYLTENSPSLIEDFPYLAELADYECTKRQVDLNDDGQDTINLIEPEKDQDLLDHPLVLSASLNLKVYEWPVHQIEQNSEIPDAPPATPTSLLIFRDREMKVQVIELDFASARLLLGLQSQPELNARAHLDAILSESDQAPSDTINRGAMEMLRSLQNHGIIRGIQLH